MSRTTMFVAPKAGPVKRHKQYTNAWRSAMWVWMALGEKYLGDRHAVMPNNGDVVWELAEDVRLDRVDRAVLLFTFDRCMAEADRLEELADLFDNFSQRYGSESHLPQMAIDLRELVSSPSVGDQAGVCWQQTSVSENLWWVRVEGEEDGRPYDLSRDEGHFWLFADLDGRAG